MLGSPVPMVPLPGAAASALESYSRFLVSERARDRKIELESHNGYRRFNPQFTILTLYILKYCAPGVSEGAPKKSGYVPTILKNGETSKIERPNKFLYVNWSNVRFCRGAQTRKSRVRKSKFRNNFATTKNDAPTNFSTGRAVTLVR